MKKALLMACVAGVMLLSENEVESTNAVSAGTVFSQLQAANAEIAQLQRQLEELRPVAAQGTNLKNVGSFLGDTDLSNLDGVLSETQLQEIAAMRALKQVDDITEIDTESNDPRAPAALLSPEVLGQIKALKTFNNNDRGISVQDLSNIGLYRKFLSHQVRCDLVRQLLKLNCGRTIFMDNWCQGIRISSQTRIGSNFGKLIKTIIKYDKRIESNDNLFSKDQASKLIEEVCTSINLGKQAGYSIDIGTPAESTALFSEEFKNPSDYFYSIVRIFSSIKNFPDDPYTDFRAAVNQLLSIISEMLVRFPGESPISVTLLPDLYNNYNPTGNGAIENGFGDILNVFISSGNNAADIYNALNTRIKTATPANPIVKEETLWDFDTNISTIERNREATLQDYLALISAIAEHINTNSTHKELIEPLKSLIENMVIRYPCTPK